MAKHKAATKAPPADAAPPPEGYTVLARRYRPQGFEDLVGQEPVARALANALSGNRVAHAYLFTGARGVGKTSTARILAKALNCEKGPTPTPCGVCPSCQSIAAGEDVDVLEIDGASNNSVDDVRDIRGNVQYLPQRSRFKIYIIDEVHMLSKGAFNALGSIGYWLKEEFTPAEKMSHDEGVVGACRGEEPDSAATRFYITLTKAPFLDGHYTIFGKVVAGVDVLRTMGKAPVIVDDEGASHPEKPIVIEKVTITTTEGK